MAINTALPVSRLINVDVVSTPTLAEQFNFNSCLLLGTSTVIDVTERIREYASLAEIAVDFGSVAEEYLGAVAWFGQNPAPTSLQIGRWAKTASNGQLMGGPVSAANQLIAGWNAITTGAMLVYVDAIPYAVTGMNFSASANMNGVAAVMQTALVAAGAAGATVKWDPVRSQLYVTSGTTGVTSLVSFVADATATGYITFAANPAAAATVTLNGTAITFVAAGPVGNQVLIGATLQDTLNNLTTFANASANANIIQASYSNTATRLYVVSKVTGAGGNAFTLAASVATPSGGTLTGGTGTSIATRSALRQADAAYLAPGVAAETAVVCVTLLDNQFSNAFYGLVIPSASSNDHLAVSAYVDAANSLHFYGVTTQDVNVLSALSTTDIAYLMKQQGDDHAMVQYSSSSPYAVLSALARILTVNWDGTGTAITLMYKLEPGITPERLTVQQVNALEDKNCNVFVSYNNATSILEKGNCPSGQYVDSVIGVDWFASYIQTNLFNVLYGSTSKIPQTDAGNHILATSIESSCSQAALNGLLGSGYWNTGGFGQLKQGDFLPKGYYVYQPPISTQVPGDRTARKSVPFQIAAKLAGAIHTVDVILNVNQ